MADLTGTDSKGRTPNAFVQFAAQLRGPSHTEMWQGREWRVIPATIIQSQVLHNNLGRTFLPAEAFTKEWAASANMSPVLVDHPTRRGQAVSGRDPAIFDSMGAGWLMRARVENTQMKGDVFIDVGRADAVPDVARIVKKVDAGEPAEISGGFPVFQDERKGAFNGAEFDSEIWPTGWDHTAIFADKTGACSVKDGCGLGVNHKGPCEGESTVDEDKVAAGLFDKLKTFFSGQKPDEPVKPGDDAINNGDNDMTREELIAQLSASGPLTDCERKKLGINETPADEPKGDGWDKAREWRTKFEEQQQKFGPVFNQQQEKRKEMLDDLIFNAKHLSFSEAEIKAMDFETLEKVYRLAFPPRSDYSGLGAPLGGSAFNASFVKPIIASSGSALDKETH